MHIWFTKQITSNHHVKDPSWTRPNNKDSTKILFDNSALTSRQQFEFCNKNASVWLDSAHAPSVRGRKYDPKPVYESHGSDLQHERSSLKRARKMAILSERKMGE